MYKIKIGGKDSTYGNSGGNWPAKLSEKRVRHYSSRGESCVLNNARDASEIATIAQFSRRVAPNGTRLLVADCLRAVNK